MIAKGAPRTRVVVIDGQRFEVHHGPDRGQWLIVRDELLVAIPSRKCEGPDLTMLEYRSPRRSVLRERRSSNIGRSVPHRGVREPCRWGRRRLMFEPRGW